MILQGLAMPEGAIRELNAQFVEIPIEASTPELVSGCQALGLKVIVCATQNDVQEYLQILESRADMVMLDRPDLFLELMRTGPKSP